MFGYDLLLRKILQKIASNHEISRHSLATPPTNLIMCSVAIMTWPCSGCPPAAAALAYVQEDCSFKDRLVER